MKSVLITGGAGFIGSNFITLMLGRHPDWTVVNADALTYAANLDNLRGADGKENHKFVKCDIADPAISSLFDEYRFDYVVNFAAESHVDRSIKEPDIFIKTNVMGTQRLLDCAMQSWQTAVCELGYPVYKDGVKFVQVSTDEVYGPSAEGKEFSEYSPLSPSSPYAASKAAADLLAGAYSATYRLPICITRSSNNYGPRQHHEKLIPLAIRCALADESIPVYGDGLQQRDWLHVYDNCSAIEAVLLSGRPGEIYNVGSGIKRTNIEVITMILKTLGKPESLISHVRDRLGHDRRYGIDTSKTAQELGWKPEYSFDRGIVETAEWYVKHKDRL